MTKHFFRTTSPVKEPKKLLTDKRLNSLSKLLTKPKTAEEIPIQKVPETKPSLAKALIEGLETNNYNLFGELLLESKRHVEQKRIKTYKSSKELINEFTNALISKDLKALADLLDDNGAFIVINKTFETVAVIKEQYINWMRFKLQTDSVTSVDMDICSGCSLGKTVVLYNNGDFPWEVNTMGDATKAGLDFVIKNEKITGIKFCYKFTKTKNQLAFEKRYDIYQAYLHKGYSKTESYKLSEDEWKK